MAKRQLSFEWTVLEEWGYRSPGQGAGDEPLSEPLPPVVAPVPPAVEEAASRATSRQEQWVAAMLALVVALAAGGWLWRAQTQQAAVVRELHQAVVLAERAAQLAEQSARRLPEDAWSTPVGVFTAQDRSVNGLQRADCDLVGDRALARLTVNVLLPDGKLTTYRETRFYRKTGAGWAPMEPDPVLLGPWQTLETEHFTLRYRPVDAAAVLEAAKTLDRLYREMRHDFGLPPPGPAQTILIEVTGGQLTFFAGMLEPVAGTLTVPSPTLLQVLVELSDVEVLEQALVYELAGLVSQQVIAEQPELWQEHIAHQWLPLLQALRLWEVWVSEGPLAGERAAVVRWLYTNTQAETYQMHRTVPAGYEQLCRLYRVWRFFPTDTGIPLTCTQYEPTSPLYPQLANRLALLTPFPVYEIDPPSQIAMTVSTETVLEYVVATYGREGLPSLMGALDEYGSWATLAPAVFEVSVEEFEAGWLAYLEANYGGSPAD